MYKKYVLRRQETRLRSTYLFWGRISNTAMEAKRGNVAAALSKQPYSEPEHGIMDS